MVEFNPFYIVIIFTVWILLMILCCLYKTKSQRSRRTRLLASPTAPNQHQQQHHQHQQHHHDSSRDTPGTHSNMDVYSIPPPSYESVIASDNCKSTAVPMEMHTTCGNTGDSGAGGMND